MFSSIRIRLTLWYICVLALVIIAFATVTYSLLVNALKKETDENLTELAQTISDSIKADQSDDEIERTPNGLVTDALDEFRFRDYQFALFTNDDKFISKTTETDLPPDIGSATDPDRFGNINIDGQPFRVFLMLFHVEDHNYKLYAFHSLDDQIALEDRIRHIFYLVAPLLLLLAGMGGYFLARKSLKPIAEMGQQAKLISATNHERLPITNAEDELGNLAITFNELLDRLDIEFDRQQRFMADASHELRTPLAIIRGESEVALSKNTRTSEEYQESLRVVNEEGKRLTKIVEDLLTLARADSGELKTRLRELYLDELIADCVRSIRTLADKRNITIEFKSDETQIKGDETLLRRLFLNLIDNAVKYNIDGGKIKIDVAHNEVTISNTGDEIPTDQQNLIFDRFFRIEKSRTHKDETMTSGAGLGLSIAKWIADLHNAHLEYSRSHDGENIFTITFFH